MTPATDTAPAFPARLAAALLAVSLAHAAMLPPGHSRAQERDWAVPTDSVRTELDSMLADHDEGSPGAVVGVIRDGELVFSRAYGMADLTHRIRVTDDTRFNLGSASKQFTAFAFALLEQRGELSLDDPVSKHLSDWPEFGETVTLRHLLTHTSGYREAYGMLALAGRRTGRDRLPRAEALEVVRRQPELEFPPGSEWTYNSTAYVILTEIAEEVTGQPFPEWMEENVFAPLGMDETTIEAGVGDVIPGAAYSYSEGGNGELRMQWSNRAIYGAADVYTTVGDLAKWVGNFGSAELGGRSVQEAMREPFVLTSGDTTSYGLGLFIDEHRGLRRIQHGGGHAAFVAQISYYPELDAGSVAMTNSDDPGLIRAVSELEDLAFARRMEPEAEEPSAGEGGNGENAEEPGDGDSGDSWKPGPEELEAYAGRYVSPELETVYTFAVADSQLVATHRWNPDFRFTPVEKDVFRLGEAFRVRFERNEVGYLTGYYVSVGRTRDVWFGRVDRGIRPD